MLNTWPFFHNRENMVSSEPSNLRKKMSSWQNDIQSLVKRCRILALYFFPMCRISVECLTSGGTEFTLTAALF
jgi:hypothetical protein